MPVVGIDFGTTFSSVAYRDYDGSIALVPNQHGKNLTPSVVAIQNGRAVVGENAKILEQTQPDKVFVSIKRKL